MVCACVISKQKQANRNEDKILVQEKCHDFQDCLGFPFWIEVVVSRLIPIR